LALLYALFSGLRTTGDMDLGWQLATGRWIVQHHAIPSTDVLSYTARGKEWIYPALSQVLLYGFFLLGGYAMLTWVSVTACVGTIAILLRKGGVLTAVLAILAVPMIAWRTHPRAEMFTELLFAGFVSILWWYHRVGRGRLWLLPVLMALWVNLHLGFIAGLAMCGAYVLLECGELLDAGARSQALARLRVAAPWLLLTGLATFLNPWGPRLYLAIARQNAMMRVHSRWIAEWAQVRLTPASLAEVLDWRGPAGSFLWLLSLACVAIAVAVYRRRFAPALVLAAAVYAVIHAVRLQGPFSSLVVVIGGAVLADALSGLRAARPQVSKMLTPAAIAVAAALAVMVAVRIGDLASNRYYLKMSSSMLVFGAGDYPLFPQAAADFVKREKLPGNLLNDFNSGGFLAWRLGQEYPDYIDGRSVPFGAELFLNLERLMHESPDAAGWQREAEARQVNTVVVSLDYLIGGGLSSLDKFCAGRNWRPVFLDPYGAVLLRNTPQNADLISRLQVDCQKVAFDTPPGGSTAEEFRYYLNAASVLIVLDRTNQALAMLDKAEAIFRDSPYLHYAKGSALRGAGRDDEAEKELLLAISLGSDDAPYALARVYDQQRRYAEETRVLRNAAEKSAHPHWLYLKLGYAQLAMGNPGEALRSFDKAEKESPFLYEADALGAEFRTQLQDGRRQAQREKQN
jgi:tetratricopeptide (TPR) repeat protein